MNSSTDANAQSNPPANPTPATLQRILRTCRTIAVVGLSAEPQRASFGVARYMQERGYRIVPVNPRYAATGSTILGETCYATLAEIPFPVDMVDVFRRAEDMLPIAQQALATQALAKQALAQQALALHPLCFWQQLGISNLEADALVRGAGMVSVYNRCLKIEHAALMA